MQQAAFVDRREARAQLAHQRATLGGSQPATCEPLAEVFARKPFRRDEKCSVAGLALRDVANDRWVREVGQDLGFRRKSLIRDRIALVQNFDRDRFARREITAATVSISKRSATSSPGARSSRAPPESSKPERTVDRLLGTRSGSDSGTAACPSALSVTPRAPVAGRQNNGPIG
jgi:hypothetical protein